MAVSRMKQISIIGRMDSLDQVVRVCGGSGVMQPDDAITFFPIRPDLNRYGRTTPIPSLLPVCRRRLPG